MIFWGVEGGGGDFKGEGEGGGGGHVELHDTCLIDGAKEGCMRNMPSLLLRVCWFAVGVVLPLGTPTFSSYQFHINLYFL